MPLHAFPRPWKIIDAGSAIPMSQIVCEYDQGLTGYGTMTRTLERIEWDDAYNVLPRPSTYTPIPAGKFVCIRWSPMTFGMFTYATGESWMTGVYGGMTIDPYLLTDGSIAGPSLEFPSPMVMQLSVAALTDASQQVSLSALSGYPDPGGAGPGVITWSAVTPSGIMDTPSPMTTLADAFNWTVNGKARANSFPGITVTGIAFEKGSRRIVCDDTSGIEAGMFGGLVAQVAAVIDGTTLLSSRPMTYSAEGLTGTFFGGAITDAGSGDLDIGIELSNSATEETFTITVS